MRSPFGDVAYSHVNNFLCALYILCYFSGGGLTGVTDGGSLAYKNIFFSRLNGRTEKRVHCMAVLLPVVSLHARKWMNSDSRY